MDNRVSYAVKAWKVRGPLCSLERAHRDAATPDVTEPSGFWTRVGLGGAWRSLQRELQEVANDSRRVPN